MSQDAEEMLARMEENLEALRERLSAEEARCDELLAAITRAEEGTQVLRKELVRLEGIIKAAGLSPAEPLPQQPRMYESLGDPEE